EMVVKPLEKRFYALDDIKKIQTSVANGVVSMVVEYEFDVDYDDKYQETVRELNAARSDLPENIYSAEVRKVNPSGVRVIQVSLVSETASREKMREWSQKLKSRLERIKALKNVEVNGIPDKLVRIDVDINRLDHLGIPLNRVVETLKRESKNIPGGSVVGNGNIYSVKTSGNY